MFPLIAGLAVGAIGSIGKAIGRGKANKQMEKLMNENPIYQENPLAKQRLGYAQVLVDSRMPGATQAERNIFTNQATQLGRLDRSATDASQALALASGIGAQTDKSLIDLGMTEAQDYQRRYGNLVDAQEGVIRENDKVFQDQTRRWSDKVGIRGAQQQNRQNTWGDISNFGFAVANMAASGAFGGGGETNRSVMNSLNSGGITGGLTGGLPRTSLGNVGQMGGRPSVGNVLGAYSNPMATPRPFSLPQYNQPFYPR